MTSLKGKGFQTGLWTQRSLSNIAWQVGTAGTRMVKTDVAWVGGGYQGAFDGVNSAVQGIENKAWTTRGGGSAGRPMATRSRQSTAG
ncbi:hypothetical protein [Saccharothrix sp.]|uniref:hypothetical protein n=1 Tax=Saccharothrix sp. TaxID=1873460 RepID=UPI002810A4F4|nr:hypothetical protein [Saccharothrix sp.]